MRVYLLLLVCVLFVIVLLLVFILDIVNSETKYVVRKTTNVVSCNTLIVMELGLESFYYGNFPSSRQMDDR